MARYLTIIEVSQKQAYIFAENKLKSNINRSREIAYITSIEYIQSTLEDTDSLQVSEHLVYTGGGHTIMEFGSEQDARKVVRALTRKVLIDFPQIELFAKTTEYDEKRTPGENIKNLTAELEKKKSLRISSFHQGTFGIEQIETNTRRAKTSGEGVKIKFKPEPAPEGFLAASRFEDLGGTKGENNYIAVVHIDGNSMGKRVEALTEKYTVGQWEQYKKEMRAFSEALASDFLSAYGDMEKVVAENIRNSRLQSLDLKEDERSKCMYLPVRRVISEGDDICFVSEGRIGIECAVLFLRKLAEKENDVDHNKYSACAGVAIVHQKYPFYKAYELAEELCSNAKRFGASLGKDGTSEGISAIDWHIAYGELMDSLEEERRSYVNHDGARLELRPYIVEAPQTVLEHEPIRRYANFRSLADRMSAREEAYGRGRLKELRQVLKQGEHATQNYLRFHKIEEIGRDIYYGIYKDTPFEETKVGSGKSLERKLFVQTADGENRSLLFDVIEGMDAYLTMEEQ